MQTPYYKIFLTRESVIDKEIIAHCFYEEEITKSKLLLQTTKASPEILTKAYEEYKNLIWVYTKGNTEGFLLKLRTYETRNVEFRKLKELNDLARKYVEIYKTISDVYDFNKLEKQLKDEIRKYMGHL
jgi:hypothetical protein